MVQVQNNATRANDFLLQLLSAQDMCYAWCRDAEECLRGFNTDVSSISNREC